MSVKTLLTNLWNCFMEDSSLDDVSDDCWDPVDCVDSELIQKRLQERKQAEEADHELTNELFNENYVKPPIHPKKTLKINVDLINKSHINPHANPHVEIRIKKNSRKEWKKRKELFGESELDEVDEMSDDIHEKHAKVS